MSMMVHQESLQESLSLLQVKDRAEVETEITFSFKKDASRALLAEELPFLTKFFFFLASLGTKKERRRQNKSLCECMYCSSLDW